jgi:hypothetical protein
MSESDKYPVSNSGMQTVNNKYDQVVRYWFLINNKPFNTVFNQQISYSIEMY